MGFQLSGLWSNKNKTTSQTGTGKTVPSSDAAHYKAQSEIRGMMPGQTLSGEVIAKNGNEVQIRLNKDTVITARLDHQINVTEGQSMTFEIKSNNNSQLALRPLYANLSQDPNLLKALQAAGIQANDKSLQMVSTMMEKGLSIDKNTLLQVYKDVMANPSASMEDMVALHKMGIPVTTENLVQMEQYRNLEHQILGSIETIAEEVTNMILDMVDTDITGKPVQAAEVFQRLILVLTEGESLPNFREAPLETILPSTQNAQELISKDGQLNAETALLGKVNPNTELVLEQETIQTIQKEQKNLMSEGVNKELPQTPIFLDKDNISSLFTLKEQENFLTLLRQAGVPEETLSQMRQGGFSAAEMLRQIADWSVQGMIPKEAFEKLISSKEVKILLQNSIENHMLLRPEEVADKKAVEKFYDRIYEQTAKLSEVLAQTGKADTVLAKDISQMRSNVEFMNQLNQVFTYVQLPIKLSGQNANGDLYVYTNKKNLAKEDGQVSALLHLEMEYLGVVDIYVAMQGERVNTKFYLQKEEMLDFIEANISLLNERLQKRGYQLNAEVIHREDTKSVVQEMVEQNGNTGILSTYSFDMRA